MARQWLDERYLHYIHHDNTTNRYQLAGMTRQWLVERYLHYIHHNNTTKRTNLLQQQWLNLGKVSGTHPLHKASVGSTTDGTNFLAGGTRRWLNQQGMYISYII